MFRFLWHLLPAALLAASLPTMAAEMTVSFINSEHQCKAIHIKLHGEIKSGDAKQLSNWLEQYSQKSCDGESDLTGSVHFRSEGGNVSESLALGRAIRKYGLNTVVLDVNHCFSSCVFAFVGGVDKIAFGKFGIHRPFFSELDRNLKPQQIKAIRDEMNSTIVAYLKEMDVSPYLLDDMMSIAPEKMKILTKEELARYRINVRDANIDEAKTAANAYRYGMTSAEYRRKSESYFESCYKVYGASNATTDCYEAKMYNISTKELRKRRKASDKCDDVRPSSAVEECYRRIFLSIN